MNDNRREEVRAGLKPALTESAAFMLFLPEDRKEAQRVFNTLPLKSQLDIVLHARGKERLSYLFLSENPERLVRSFPELEIFLTVLEVGEKDALDLISLTTAEQFQYLLDLAFWKKDRLNSEKILRWMETLLECGEKKVVQFIRFTDPESIGLLLEKFLHVTVLEGEPLEDGDRLPAFTLDQYYFIHFRKREARAVFQPFLQIVYRLDPNFYRALMETLLFELESQLEETGYRLRNGRLADSGLPGIEEASEIYRYVNPDSLVSAGPAPPAAREERKEGRGTTVPPAGEEGEMEKAYPTFYLTFAAEGPFFSSLLNRIADPLEADRLNQEVTALCNKAIVAEPIDLFTIEEMGRVTKKVFHYLNLGLQYLGKEDETKAFELLRSLPIQRIFQCGVSLTLRLRSRAESLLKGSWFGGDRESLLLLDPPHLEKFGGILRKRPGIVREGAFQDLTNLHDLKELEIFLESVDVIVRTLGGRLNLSPRSLKELAIEGCYPDDWRSITLSTLFLTGLANQTLEGVFRFEAIEKARLDDFSSRIFDRNEQGKGVVKMEIRKGIKDCFESIEDDETRRQHLLAFRDFCLDLLEEEYGKIPPGEEIDPRFIKGLLVRT